MEIKHPLRIKQIEKIGKALIALDEDGKLWVVAYFEAALGVAIQYKTPMEWRPLSGPEKVL